MGLKDQLNESDNIDPDANSFIAKEKELTRVELFRRITDNYRAGRLTDEKYKSYVLLNISSSYTQVVAEQIKIKNRKRKLRDKRPEDFSYHPDLDKLEGVVLKAVDIESLNDGILTIEQKHKEFKLLFDKYHKDKLTENEFRNAAIALMGSDYRTAIDNEVIRSNCLKKFSNSIYNEIGSPVKKQKKVSKAKLKRLRELIQTNGEFLAHQKPTIKTVSPKKRITIEKLAIDAHKNMSFISDQDLEPINLEMGILSFTWDDMVNTSIEPIATEDWGVRFKTILALKSKNNDKPYSVKEGRVDLWKLKDHLQS